LRHFVTNFLALKCELLFFSINVINDDLYNDSRIRNTANFDLVERQTSDCASDKRLPLYLPVDTVSLSILSIDNIISWFLLENGNNAIFVYEMEQMNSSSNS